MPTVHIADDLAPRIAAAAAGMGLTEEAFLREAVLVFLARLEHPPEAGAALGRSAGPDAPGDRSAQEHPGLGF